MASMVPVWVSDFIGNLAILGISIYIIFKVARIIKLRPHAPLWMYLQWQVIALAVFAFSHSVGHIVKRILVIMGHRPAWEAISPYTGSINSISFVVVAVLSFLYKDLESASEKYGALELAKKELDLSTGKLQDSYRKMERDADEIFLKNKEITVLNRIAMAASKSLEMDNVMSAIIQEVKEFLGVDFLGIYLVDKNRITLRVWEGLSQEFRDKAATRSLEEPWLKREVMEGKCFFAQERLEEHGGKIDPDIKAEGMQGWVAVPLMAKGRVVGVLTVGSSKYDGINPLQIKTLTTIGGYAGVVIENSMLYEELKQKVEDLERFRKFSVGREMRIIELKERLKEMEKGMDGSANSP